MNEWRDSEVQWLQVLSTAECHQLLIGAKLGRVAVSIGGLPAILPVLYQCRDGSVWFFTEEGTKLNAAVLGEVVAFEVDHLGDQGGWSVLVIGECREEPDSAVIADLHAGGLQPGAPGHREHLVCVPIHRITGRSYCIRHDPPQPGYA